MRDNQRLQLADKLGVVSSGEVSLDPLLETSETKLLQANDLGLGEGVIGKLRERRPSPQRQRLIQPSLFLQALEASEIELVLLHA